MLMKNKRRYDATSGGLLGSQVVYLYCVYWNRISESRCEYK